MQNFKFLNRISLLLALMVLGGTVSAQTRALRGHEKSLPPVFRDHVAGSIAGKALKSMDCEANAIFGQPPVDATTAYLSSVEGGFVVFQNYEATEDFVGMSFWFLQLQWNGAGWDACGLDPMPTQIAFMADNGGMPDVDNPYAEFEAEISAEPTGEFFNNFPVYKGTVYFEEPVDLQSGWFALGGSDVSCWSLLVNTAEFEPGSMAMQISADGAAVQDLPIAYCLLGPPPADDIQFAGFEAPMTGPGLGATEEVTIHVRNGGTNDIVGFTATLTDADGDELATEQVTLTEPLAFGEVGAFTFSTTFDLSTPATDYTFNACVTSDVDQDEDNNCGELTVRNTFGEYCEATGQTCDEYIGNVIIDDIFENPSECDNYAFYEETGLMMVPGAQHSLTIENQNPYTSDQCGVWIDWNADGTFAPEEALTMAGSPGVGPYTSTIVVPADAAWGHTVRMRIRVTWNTAPLACGPQLWGEVEDYAILLIDPATSSEVMGVVTDDVTDEPIEGAIVHMGPASTETDAMGEYQFDYVVEGAVDWEVEAFGYFSQSGTTTIEAQTSYTIDFELDPIPTYTFGGIVVDASTDEPIEGAEIWLSGYDFYYTMTNANGEYTISGVYEGEYDATISQEGYQDYFESLYVSQDVLTGFVELFEIPYPVDYVYGESNEEETVATIEWGPFAGEAGYMEFFDTDAPGWEQTGGFYADNGLGMFEGEGIDDFQGATYPGTYGDLLFEYEVARIGGNVNSSMGAFLRADASAEDGFESGYLFVTTQSGFFHIFAVNDMATGDLVSLTGDWIESEAFNTELGAFNTISIMAVGGEVGMMINGEPTFLFQDDSFEAGASGIVVYDNPSADDEVAFNYVMLAPYVTKATLPEFPAVAGQRLGGDFKGVEAHEYTLRSDVPSQGIANLSQGGQKVLESYRLYLLEAGQEEMMDSWTSIGSFPTTQTSTTYADWASLDAGVYRFALESEYTFDSGWKFSNDVPKGMDYDVTITLETNGGDSPEGAWIAMMNQDGDPEHSYEGFYGTEPFLFDEAWVGTYDVMVVLENYEIYEGTLTVVDAAVQTTISLEETIEEPFGLAVEVMGYDAHFAWNQASDFYDDFNEGSFDKWFAIEEGDGTPGEGGMPYFHIAGPSLFDESPYYANADWGYDIDTWMISPELFVAPGTELAFWWNASYYWHVDPNDNGDLFVKVSTDGGQTWESVWTFGEIGVFENFVWYETILDMSDYEGMSIHFAYNLVADDNSQVQMENVSFGAMGKAAGTRAISNHDLSYDPKAKTAPKFDYELLGSADKAFEGYTVYLDGTMVAEGVMETEYMFEDLAAGVYTAGVRADYTSGSSATQEIEFEIFDNYTASIHVMDADMASLEGAEVHMGEHMQMSGADGWAHFHNMVDGDYDYMVMMAGYDTETGTVTVDGADVETQVTLTLTTYAVRFNCNMNVQIDGGAFDPEVDFLDIAGSLNNWGNGDAIVLTDDNGDGIYTATVEGFLPGDAIEYKYRMNGNWETSEFPGGGANRMHTVIAVDPNVLNDVYNNGNIVAVEAIGSMGINMFPNPASQQVNFTNVAGADIELFNLLGQRVLRVNNAQQNHAIDLGQLPSGSYLVRVTKGGELSSARLNVVR